LHAGISLIVIGVLAMTGRAFHLSPTTLPLAIGAISVIGCGGRILSRRWVTFADDEAKTDLRGALISWLGFLLLAAVAGSAYLVYAYWMGRGALPEYFYGVDSAFHLGLVHALVQSDLLPPPSLTYAGAVLPYQYGILDAASTLARLTGAAPHAAFFLITMPMMVMAIAAGCWGILARTTPPILKVCCFGVMFVSTFEHWSIRRGVHLVEAVSLMVRKGAGTELPIDQNFQHTATLAGLVVVLYTIWACFTDRRPAARLFGAFLIGLLVCVKSLFFLTLGLWIGVIAFADAGLESHRQGWRPAALVKSLRHFAYPVVALAVALMVQFAQGLDGGALHIAFAPFADPYVNKNLGKLLQHMLILLAPLVLLIAFTRGRFWSRDVALSLLLIVATYAFVSMTALVWADSAETDFNWFQVASITPLLFGLLLCSAYATGWGRIKSSFGHYLLIAGIVASFGSQLLREGAMAINTAANPARGWESLDNRQLIAALSCIPVDGSVTVTNDLRSPAENYKRPYRNTQLAAIMGQHFYFSVPAYDHAQAGWDQRMDQQHLLESDRWSDDITQAAAKAGWTHFLVHQTVSHPADIPLQKVCEQGEYVVYRF